MANQHCSPFEEFKEEYVVYPDVTTFQQSLSLGILIIDKITGSVNTTSVPQQLFLAIKKLLITNSNTTIKICNKQMIGSEDDILLEKEPFDNQFKSEIFAISDTDYTKKYFVVCITQTFGKINEDCRYFLEQHSLWLRRFPGPPGTTNLQVLGMISNIPKYASLVSVKRDVNSIMFQASTVVEIKGAPEHLLNLKLVVLDNNDTLSIHIQQVQAAGKIGDK